MAIDLTWVKQVTASEHNDIPIKLVPNHVIRYHDEMSDWEVWFFKLFIRHSVGNLFSCSFREIQGIALTISLIQRDGVEVCLTNVI